MTNATGMSVTEVIELDSLRWQIELYFQERKSTLGFHQYRFQDFAAVRAWAEIALTTILFLEYERAKHLTDRRAPPDARRWWQSQRLHGLCSAFRQASAGRELYRSREKRTLTRSVSEDATHVLAYASG